MESFELFFRYPDRALEFSPLWTLPQVLQYFSRNKSQKIHDVLEILSPFIRKYHRYFSLFLCFFSSFRSHEFNFSSGFVTRNLLNSIFGSSGRNRLTRTKNLKLEYIEIRIYSQVTNVVMLLQLEFPVIYFLFLNEKRKVGLGLYSENLKIFELRKFECPRYQIFSNPPTLFFQILTLNSKSVWKLASNNDIWLNLSTFPRVYYVGV